MAAELKPDGVLQFAFPELPRPLQSIIDEETYCPQASVYLPRNYTPDARVPAVCFLGGAGGGRGTSLGAARSVTRDEGFVCINLPHFKAEVDPLEPDGGNKWMRMHLWERDTEVIWYCYETMLDHVFSEVPNVDTSRSFLGGMSNGAHATALLLNGRFEEITSVFQGFFLIEGGQFLEPLPRLAGIPFLLLQGELQDKIDLPDLAERLREVGAKARFRWMKGVGHSFPEPEHAVVGRWIEAHLQ